MFMRWNTETEWKQTERDMNGEKKCVNVSYVQPSAMIFLSSQFAAMLGTR